MKYVDLQSKMFIQYFENCVRLSTQPVYSFHSLSIQHITRFVDIRFTNDLTYSKNLNALCHKILGKFDT